MNFRVSSPIGVCVCSGFVHLNRSILKTKNETNENEELEETETKKNERTRDEYFLYALFSCSSSLTRRIRT